METLSLRQHLSRALALLSSNTVVIGVLGLIACAGALTAVSRGTAFFVPMSLLSITLSIALPPVIYGILHQVSSDSYTSVRTIARTYLPSYLWLLLRMYLPVIFLAGLPLLLSSEPGGEAWFHLTVVCFSLLYLYVIPYYYHTGKQNGAIAGGIGFLLRHIGASTPLILATLLLETMMLIGQQNRELLLDTGPLVFVAVDSLMYLVASVADITIFLILVFILRKEAETKGTSQAP